MCGGDGSKKKRKNEIYNFKKCPAREFIPLTVLINSKKMLNRIEIRILPFKLIRQINSAPRISVTIFAEMVTRQMTPPTENGHAAPPVLNRIKPQAPLLAVPFRGTTQGHVPPPVESRESCQSVNPDCFDFSKSAEGVIQLTIPLGKSPAW